MAPTQAVRFILTRELGRLSRWLRILGFDAEYNVNDTPGRLIIEALKSRRIILTRRHKMPQSRGVRIATINEEELQGQLIEVVRLFGLRLDAEKMFSRCVICNVALVAAEKEKVKDRVPQQVWLTQKQFVTCPVCRRIYWRGSHWGNAAEVLKGLYP
ncbi:MAG: Mut7-C RNAse domain-containing protein [Candidatus Omnitrophota bacterium]